MEKYWKYALFLAMTIIVIGTATVFAAPGGKKETNNPGPQLFTLLNRVDVEATATITSDYVNLEGYSEFKVFFQRHNTVAKGIVQFRIRESIDGIRETEPREGRNLSNSVSDDTDSSLVLSNPFYLNADWMAVRPDVGLVPHLDQRVSVMARHGKRAARPVVFEGAREQPDTVGGERAGDGVARQTFVTPPFKLERDGFAVVDLGAAGDPVHTAAQRAGHALSPLPNNSAAG